MKINPTYDVTPMCRRCLLPALTPHPTPEACILMHQAALHTVGARYDQLKAAKEKAERGYKNLIVILWKLAVGRGVIEFSQQQLDAVPKTASLNVIKKDGGLTIEAIVKNETTEQLS